MRKFKILFALTHAFTPNAGGVQRTTHKLGRKFTEMGHSVSYYITANEGNLEADYGKLFHAPKPGNVHNPENIKHLKKVLNIIKPNFVINQMPYEVKLSEVLASEKIKLNYALLGCLRNSLFSVKNNVRDTSERVLPRIIFKLLDHKIGLKLLLQLHRLKHKKQLKRILDLHDKYVLLAPPNRNELNYFVGDYKKDKVCVVPNSIPKVYYEKFKREKFILYVGTLNISQKRADLLIEFWKRTFIHLEDWKLIVLGVGSYKNEMERIIKNESIPRIELLGNQKPEEWYKKAPIFVKTSAFEGFPNVILEAQSYGCIPVTFKSYDAISWIVNDKKDALLIKPFDVDAMSIEVIKLAKEEYDIEKMSEAAKKNISRFVIDNVAEEWMNLFYSFN